MLACDQADGLTPQIVIADLDAKVTRPGFRTDLAALTRSVPDIYEIGTVAVLISTTLLPKLEDAGS